MKALRTHLKDDTVAGKLGYVFPGFADRLHEAMVAQMSFTSHTLYVYVGDLCNDMVRFVEVPKSSIVMKEETVKVAPRPVDTRIQVNRRTRAHHADEED